ncbi:MAG: hypothetical protein J6J39_05920 [Clostridia bacterium]|nr:hypothetical protein [Clostridia bacterium]
MVKRVQKYLSAVVISVICAVIFIGIGYLYISANIKQAEGKSESVPYAVSAPENVGIMFEINDSKSLIYLNFEEQSITYLNADDKSANNGSCCGYPLDYRISADYEFLSGLIDRLGGIELYYESTVPLNFTGVQVTDLLSHTVERESLRKSIIISIIEKISLVGFSRSDFAFIIENSSTDLTVPECYYWNEYMKNMCMKPHIVN